MYKKITSKQNRAKTVIVYKIEDYRVEIKSISQDNIDYWYVYYQCVDPSHSEEIIIGHLEFFAIRVNKKSVETSLIHGE